MEKTEASAILDRFGHRWATHVIYLGVFGDAARPRMALLGYPERFSEDRAGLTAEQILLRGRQRARQAVIAQEAAEPDR